MTLQELVKGVAAEEVSSQAFRYMPKNWAAFPNLPGLLSAAGYGQAQIDAGFTLSRSDVRTVVQRLGGPGGVALVPVWGYPRGVAGQGNRKPLAAVFDNAELITTTLIQCLGRQWPASRVVDAFAIPHLGLSTLSKILYFAGLESAEGPLLIYDQMVMRALHHHAFDEYGPWPAYGAGQQSASYGRFVACTAQAARALHCTPDVIEYALFREGQRLGPAVKAAPSAPAGVADDRWLHARGFTVELTWARRSQFSYRVSGAGAITLRFGRQGECTISSDQVAALKAAFRGCEVPLTTGPHSLRAWLEQHVTMVRITSYLAPVLVILGHAEHQGRYLKFPN
ncbi:8-oxoguanine DNA glycosylase OGG fold protein [Pseudoduganella albidiflava]|uniref:Uncharacterized protein n=1 Tax=Pseudoduganella albidiflava TaxID=321983 RepID=A0A411WT34_9BURK|nr:hypothetical protein [Pseudoduganella albidiflava]QBH99646.1 hypothetical protein EYF70_01400 [Pseudoduganella albidiflava]GGY46519.1 hypothetical protein GCM10007387_30820 [Pseudoduganella albidiflava]